MLTDQTGAKVTAKNKAKIVLKEHLNKFLLEECSGYDDFSKGEVVKVNEQIVKIMERVDKVLTVK